jgi:hypothetical protein
MHYTLSKDKSKPTGIQRCVSKMNSKCKTKKTWK